MIAAVLTELPATTLQVVDLPEPLVGPGQVLVRVHACGICGTDLHVMAGESYRPGLPFVLGHEFVGTVVAAPGDAGDWLGRRVVPTLFMGCGSCPPCLAGDERLCELGARVIGVLGHSGGFAAYVALPAAQLVEVTQEIPDEVAASLVDAGTTARNAVRRGLAPGEYGPARYLVLGGGPVGLFVGELLVKAGQPVVFVEANAMRRAALAERGFVVAPSVAAAEGHFSTVIDCAGSPDLVPGALELLRPHGCYLVVGYSRIPAFDLSVVSRRELRVEGVRSGRRSDLEDILALVASGRLSAPPISTWPLEEINSALRSLREGDVLGKAVVIFPSA